MPATPPPDESLVAVLDRVADPEMDSRWDVSTKRTVLIIMLVGVCGIVWLAQPVLPMVLVGAIIAYLISPIVDLLQRVHVPRAVSTITIYLLVVVLLILTPVLVVPILIDQLQVLGNFDVQSTAVSLLGWFNDSVQQMPANVDILGFPVPLGETVRQFVDQLQANSGQVNVLPSVADLLNGIQQFLSTTTNVVGNTAVIGINVVGGIFSVILTVMVTIFVALYMTMDAPKIRAYIQGLAPSSYQSELADLLRHMGHIWSQFLRGQIILSVTVGVMTGTALTIIGLPGALIFGILAGLLEVIPNLGPILSMIPAVIVALIQGADVLTQAGISNFGAALIVVGIYFIVQQLENNILVPRIIGDSINLHPIVVICAVVIGVSTFGILGALLAPPVVATFRVVGGYVHSKLLDYPPFRGRPALNKPAKPTTYRRTLKGSELEPVKKSADQTTANPTAGGTVEPPATAG
jgi:predicted PurR-regulated permease PerM